MPIKSTFLALAAIALCSGWFGSSLPRLAMMQDKDSSADPNKQDPGKKDPILPAKPVLKQVFVPMTLPKPKEKPVAQPSADAKPVEKPTPVEAAVLTVPFRTRTVALEAIGGAMPAAVATVVEFRPIRLTTASLEVRGGALSVSAESAASAAPFSPIRVRTNALEVIATGTGE